VRFVVVAWRLSMSRGARRTRCRIFHKFRMHIHVPSGNRIAPDHGCIVAVVISYTKNLMLANGMEQKTTQRRPSRITAHNKLSGKKKKKKKKKKCLISSRSRETPANGITIKGEGEAPHREIIAGNRSRLRNDFPT